MAKTGSETVGAAGEKSKMTLFKDDRAEDIGAIVLATIVIAIIMLATMGKVTPPTAQTPAAPAAAMAPAPAAPAAVPAPAPPATK
ncbi:MAG: hypothetical protein Q7J84_18755 [Sulfuricaulis sp.]|nr:hypothetical protein [Sulfuricaulis sp.]